ncbi:MAG: hypothetical protein BWY96_03039 [Spirochaetes bacterium ADurb.BinA120]|nr:MAG: hypothetical protein BWY96_03039 [Spirochaetes bacterium ADurb.BinA120]
MLDSVVGLVRVEYFVKYNSVHLHRGIVLGDDALRRKVEHLLADVDLGRNARKYRVDEIEPRREGGCVFAEALDQPVLGLWHDSDSFQDEEDSEQRYCED